MNIRTFLPSLFVVALCVNAVAQAPPPPPPPPPPAPPSSDEGTSTPPPPPAPSPGDNTTAPPPPPPAPEPDPGVPAPPPAPPAPEPPKKMPPEQVPEDLPLSITGQERFGDANGELSIGMPAEKLEKAFGQAQRSPMEYWQATGEYVEEWTFPEAGFSIEASSFTRNGQKLVRSLRVSGDSKLQTLKGIGIGSTQRDIFRAYGQHYDPDDSVPGETVVIGSMFDGIIFDIENGKVTNYFVGPAAE